MTWKGEWVVEVVMAMMISQRRLYYGDTHQKIQYIV